MRALAFFPVLLSATPVLADPATCLNELIVIPSVELPAVSVITAQTQNMTDPVSVSVTNNTEMPLVGILINYELWSSDRPAPVASGAVGAAIEIAGALMPGETFTADQRVYLDERAIELATEASALEFRFVVRNALGVDGDRHFRSPNVGGWRDTTVGTICR